MVSIPRSCIFWLDAVATKAISKKNTPFLWKLSQSNNWSFLTQESSFGFSSIPASLLTGTTANQHQQFAVYRIKKLSEPWHFWQQTSQLLPRKLKNYWFNLGRYFVGNDFFLPPIHSQVSNLVVPAQKKSYPHSHALPVESIFDYWSKQKQSFFYYNWPLAIIGQKGKVIRNLTFTTPANDQARLKVAQKYIDKYQPQHIFFHLWDADGAGHKYGPTHKMFFQTLEKYDHLAEIFLSQFNLSKDRIIIFSDHGMLPINQIIDPLQLIEVVNKSDKKLSWFADSTLLRIWDLSDSSKKALLQFLDQQKCGKTLQQDDLKKYYMDKISHLYGEVIFALNPGFAFFPTSFSSSEVPKGMHGYLNQDVSLGEKPLVAINKPKGQLMTRYLQKGLLPTHHILKAARFW